MAYDPYMDDDEEGGIAPPAPPPDAQIGVIPMGGTPAPTPTAGDPAGGGGGGKKGKGPGPDLGPIFNWPGMPGFNAPTFVRPTMNDALAEPGYQFRLDAGRGALERSAAARGVLRTGGTLTDLLEYGQKFGAQEYSNVYNRALQDFDRRYQGAKDTYAPNLAKWQTMANAEIQRAMAVYGNKNKGGGGGGGGQPQIPLELLMGPPPTPPDYASMSTMDVAAPSSGIMGGDDGELSAFARKGRTFRDRTAARY